MANIKTSELTHLIKCLEDALQVAQAVNQGDVYDYAYANGYSKSCMEGVKNYLERIEPDDNH